MSTATAFLDRYIAGQGVLHRLDARLKLVVTLGFILAMTSMPPGAWPAYGVMLALAWSAGLLSGVGLLRLFRRSLLALPFILIALPTVFTKPGATLLEVDLFVGHLGATREGAVFFASVLLKSWASVTAAALLTASTEPLRLLEALKALRVPALLVAIVSLMYRYLFVLVDEAQRLLRARSARSAALSAGSGGSIAWRAKVTGGMAGALFVRTLDRSERIYMAMLARGYDGRVVRASFSPLSWKSIAMAAFTLAVFAAVASYAQLIW